MGAIHKQLLLTWMLSTICIVSASFDLAECIYNTYYYEANCPERNATFNFNDRIQVFNFDQFRNSSYTRVKIVDDTLNSSILSAKYLRRDLQLLNIMDTVKNNYYTTPSPVFEHIFPQNDPNECPSNYYLRSQDWPWVELLDLSDNKFEEIEANSFTEISKCLNILILKHNKIEKIENLGLDSLKVLKKLDLSRNFLTVFDFNLIKDSPVEHLNLSSNYLSSIINYENDNTLTTLDLSNNLLISFELFQMQQLKSLDLSHNKLKNFKFSGSVQRRLIVLDLSFNNLKLISGMFNGLESLKSINLQYNHLITLPINTFEGLPKLNMLDLSQNNIQIRYGSFTGLDNLENLDLSSNKFIKIDFVKLMDLINLKVLIIDNNNIQSINYFYLNWMLPKLEKLSLGQNSWQCNHLAQLIISLRRIKILPIKKFELKEADFKYAIRGFSCNDLDFVESTTLSESIAQIQESAEDFSN